MRRVTALRSVATLAALTAGVAAAEEDPLERGRYLLHAGGCITCHTPENHDGDNALVGGRAMETPFGTFYTPNITPDPETGIGAWSDADFIRAFRDGISPDGSHYFPTFPYTSYTGITDQDLLDLKAYLFSLDPVHRPNQEHDLHWFVFRVGMGFWKWLNFEPGAFEPDPEQPEQWNRGAYLVRHLGHCGECHTPRSWTGGLDLDYWLAGNPDGPEASRVPNITPHESGIGNWSISDITFMLELGMLPDGDFVGGSMGAVIEDNTSKLTEEDRQAIAVYLKSLPALPSEAE